MTQKWLINEFVHRVGSHCESSSMRDLFEFHGFPMSEPMAFGLDATMGFGFFDTTNSISFIPKSDIPFFLGGKQGTIDSNSLACRLLGMTLRKQSFTSADKAWEESKKMLIQNNPLILRADLGYLPYFKIEGEIHFGCHAITLAGYDEGKKIAYVGDTEYEGFQEITIEKLKQARNSEYGPRFMRPNNTQFSMIRRSDGKHPPLAAGVKIAIQKVVNNMLRPSVNNNGIQGLKQFATSIPIWKEKLQGETKDPQGKSISRARLMFELLQGYIEKWGTGGSCFRKLYLEFLKELLIHPQLQEGSRAWSESDFKTLEEVIPILERVVYDWKLVATTLKKATDEHKSNCLAHINLENIQTIVINIVEQEELIFRSLLKIKI
ncbi:MAG: BtrH N-terminal domain-containing protein [Candidatus Thorarchaeota archaeon]